jgi:hypothetical protein
MSANRFAITGALCGLLLAISGWLLPPAAAADPPTSPPPSSRYQPSDNDAIDLEAAKIDYQAVFGAGMTGGSLVVNNRLKEILADTHVAKISTYLVQMPRAEASARVQRLFDCCLRAHMAGLVQCRARRKGEDSSKGMIPITDNAHALSASLYLCALHCDRETFLNKLDAWHSSIAPLVAECYSGPRQALVQSQTCMDGPPEKALVLNLYVIVLERDAGIQVATLDRRRRGLLPHFRSAYVPFWDAEKERFDFAHHPGSKLREYRQIQQSVSVADNWDLPGTGGGDARADEVLTSLRTLVDDIGKPGP